MMTVNEARLYLTNYQKFVDTFGMEVFARGLEKSGVDTRSFTTNEYVPLGSAHALWLNKGGYPTDGNIYRHEFEEWKGEWMRKVKKDAYCYTIPNRYQLDEHKIMEACLQVVAPWISIFNIKCYHLDSAADTDVYLKTGDDVSIYVPVKAILGRDWEVIVDRHTTYHKDYYRGEDRKKYLDKALAALDSWEAILFKFCLDNYPKEEVEASENN